ncbi:MAG: glycosyltransferase family 4 protein [Candidatus Zixiibacteriota bacterium]|nr:MAG: glycosyltransferase family 4 protein [candidate division Zixibacteria bacterium]
MRILALNWQDLTNPMAGGAEVHLEELLRRIAGRGHEITLFCSGYADSLPEEEIEGLRIIRRGSRYNFNWIAPFALRKLVKQNNFDVLIEDINKIPFYTPLYLKLPTLVVVPHLFSTTVFKEINFLLGLYIYFSEKPLVPIYRGRMFNVISESTADDIAGRGIPRSDISVIHCGIDTDTYNFDAAVRKFDHPTVLYLGRIKKYKTIQHLIIAFKKVLETLPEADLKIVGSGDYLPALKSLAGKLKIRDRIDFPGFVSQEKKVEILRRSHVAVYPSSKEGWGLTNIEANACGTAVIAANSPGLRDSVAHDRTGFLYEYGRTDELTERLVQVLTDEEKRARLEKGGLEWVKKFDWDTAADEFLSLLEQVAERG